MTKTIPLLQQKIMGKKRLQIFIRVIMQFGLVSLNYKLLNTSHASSKHQLYNHTVSKDQYHTLYKKTPM